MPKYVELLTLTSQVIALLRANEVEQAIVIVRNARQDKAKVDYDARAETIEEINALIYTLKREIEQIQGAIDTMPENVRASAKHQLGLYLENREEELSNYRAQKRKLSLPRHQ